MKIYIPSILDNDYTYHATPWPQKLTFHKVCCQSKAKK